VAKDVSRSSEGDQRPIALDRSLFRSCEIYHTSQFHHSIFAFCGPLEVHWPPVDPPTMTKSISASQRRLSSRLNLVLSGSRNRFTNRMLQRLFESSLRRAAPMERQIQPLSDSAITPRPPEALTASPYSFPAEWCASRSSRGPSRRLLC
jgi:hypothetical protein